MTDRGESAAGEAVHDPDQFVTIDAEWCASNERQVERLNALAACLMAEGRALDALEVSAARGSVEVLSKLMVEIDGHRFDTQHLIDVGHTPWPRLADRMLYDDAGLLPLAWDEDGYLAHIEAVKACGRRNEHKGCDHEGCSCTCHAYSQDQMAADILAVLTVYDEHVAPGNRGPWRERLAEAAATHIGRPS